MEPIDMNDPYAIIAMLMQLDPSFYKDGTPKGTGGEGQEDQLNYMDDQLNTIMDPAFFAAQPGGFDPAALESTWEEETIKGDQSGRLRLEKVAASATPSIEQAIAVGLLDGMSSTDVIEKLVSAGQIVIPETEDENGKMVKDTAQFDRYTAWADKQWDSYLSDTEDEVTRTEVPSELAEKFRSAALTDPRQQYDVDYLDAQGGGVYGGLREATQATEDPYQAALAARQNIPESFGDSLFANLPQGARADAQSIAQPWSAEGQGLPPALQGMQAKGNLPDAWAQQFGLGSQPPSMPGVQFGQGVDAADPYAPVPGQSFGAPAPLTLDPSFGIEQASRSTPSTNSSRGGRGGLRGRVKPDNRASQSRPTASQSAAAKKAKDDQKYRTDTIMKRQSTLMKASGDRNDARHAEGLERARLGAVSRFLQQSGRTPFMDEYTARLQGTRR